MPCGANAVANGKVTTHTPFQEGSVQAPAGDADLPDEAALLDRLIRRYRHAHRRPDAAQHLGWPAADVVDNENESSVPPGLQPGQPFRDRAARQAKPAPSAHQARRPIGSKRGRSVIPPLRDSTDALMVWAYYSDSRARAGYGECST